MTTSETRRTLDELFTRPATDEERACMELPTDAELRQALAEGERHRAAAEAVGQGSDLALHVRFK